ncbi:MULTISPECIES: NUDIX domain-containing protein [unclassified Pseudofrankia]|uniref:NUDIX domain-containing protein n=1 Tax=unclassified Pseudofrankia TaxID=2994372 RepID=UPI001F52A064|nr:MULTISPECIES: NUDIX domain-containing protein [unclassified Pseudofrankia]MDT3441263.1 NUDIX domain-containing protein [Pseudofrankia sp. BMG5.37]
MTVSNNAVVSTALGYVEANPSELDTVRDLVILSLLGPPITLRSTLPAHLACRAVVMTSDQHVLTVRGASRPGWQLPGGHVAEEDCSLLGSVLRQLRELTGIDPNVLRPESALPCDLDAVPVDPVLELDELEHVHYDFRYLLHLPSRDLGADVAADVRWVPVDEVPGRLGTKLRRSSRTPAALR